MKMEFFGERGFLYENMPMPMQYTEIFLGVKIVKILSEIFLYF